MVGNVCEVTEGRTLLVITQVSSGLTLNKPLIQSCIRCILLCLMLTKPAPVRDSLAIFMEPGLLIWSSLIPSGEAGNVTDSARGPCP